MTGDESPARTAEHQPLSLLIKAYQHGKGPTLTRMKSRKLHRLAKYCVGLAITGLTLTVAPLVASANYSSWTSSSVCSYSGSNWNAGGSYPWNADSRNFSSCTAVGVKFPGLGIAWSTTYVNASKNGSKPTSTTHYATDYPGCGCQRTNTLSFP